MSKRWLQYCTETVLWIMVIASVFPREKGAASFLRPELCVTELCVTVCTPQSEVQATNPRTSGSALLSTL